jgi:mRNA-degrading endonuclease RelE of RelBE toxin-antitoxin system
LGGKLKGCYSLRAWPYRIIYQIIKKSLYVAVIRILHRQGAY